MILIIRNYLTEPMKMGGSKNGLQALDSHPVNLYVNTLPIDNSVLKPNTPR